MKKRYSLLLIVLILFSNKAYATSGACSYHGGVDCSAGTALDGNAVCSDGTESSVSYSSMSECGGGSVCTPPSQYTYTDNSQCGALEEQQARSGGEYTPQESSGIVDDCKSQVLDYQAAEQAYQVCLNSKSTYSPPILTSSASCRIQYGVYSIPSTSAGYCSCQQGYHFGDNKQCVPIPVAPTPVSLDSSCKAGHGQYSMASTTDSLYCSCQEGYYFSNDSSKQCVPIDAYYCNLFFGDGYVANANHNGCEKTIPAVVKPAPVKPKVVPKKSPVAPKIKVTGEIPTMTPTSTVKTIISTTTQPKDSFGIESIPVGTPWYTKVINYLENLFR